jgi:DNA repair protein RecO (recombination protein O)
MAARIQGEAAFALHSRPYRETSAIAELLTLQHGLVSAVARGVRGPRRQRGRSGLSVVPFTRLVVSCAGRTQLLTLTGADAIRHHWLTGAALYAGLYLNELVMRLLRHQDPHPELFLGYEATVAGLDAPGADIEPLLRRFEKLLLRESGYELVFDCDASTGEPVDPEASYRFVPELGFVRAPLAVAEGESDDLVLRGATLLAIADDDYSDHDNRRAAKRIIRRALGPHLVGRGLHSRALFKEWDVS